MPRPQEAPTRGSMADGGRRGGGDRDRLWLYCRREIGTVGSVSGAGARHRKAETVGWGSVAPATCCASAAER